MKEGISHSMDPDAHGGDPNLEGLMDEPAVKPKAKKKAKAKSKKAGGSK